jgi:hypothetical protein
LGERGVAMRKVDEAVAHQNHRVEEGRFFDGVLRVEGIQGGAPRARLFPDAANASTENLLVVVVPRQ